jgi:hypothetical protein
MNLTVAAQRQSICLSQPWEPTGFVVACKYVVEGAVIVGSRMRVSSEKLVSNK